MRSIYLQSRDSEVKLVLELSSKSPYRFCVFNGAFRDFPWGVLLDFFAGIGSLAFAAFFICVIRALHRDLVLDSVEPVDAGMSARHARCFGIDLEEFQIVNDLVNVDSGDVHCISMVVSAVSVEQEFWS